MQVWEVFNALDAEELRLLSKFVRSPLHNRHEKVIELFDLLRYIKRQRTALPDDEWFYGRLFPEETFDVQRLRHIRSYFFKALEQFLAWNDWRQLPVTQNCHLQRAYRQHRLTNRWQAALQKGFEVQEQQPLRNGQYWQQNYELQVEAFNFDRAKGRTREFNLQEMTETLDRAYIVEKLKNACILLSHQTVIRKQYETGLLPRVLDYLAERPDWLKIPAVAIYYHAFQALSEEEGTAHFKALRDLLVPNEKAFETTELREIYILAINFCIRAWNTGRKNYMKDLFELYQSGLAASVFFENGVLSRWTYNNIVIAGLKREEFNWVYRFLHDYREKLPPRHREGSYNYNLARYYFDRNDYNKAMPLLLQMEHDDVLHNIMAKAMLVKMYYELEERESLSSLLASFKVFIHRQKGLGYHKENYGNFVRVVSKLTMTNPYDPDALQKLKQEVEAVDLLTEREWVLQQLEQLSVRQSG